MTTYTMILKHADDTVHRIEIPKEELVDAITQIERKGSEIILLEKNAASHAEDGMTNLRELIDEGLIKLTPVRTPVCEQRDIFGCEDCPKWSRCKLEKERS